MHLNFSVLLYIRQYGAHIWNSENRIAIELLIFVIYQKDIPTTVFILFSSIWECANINFCSGVIFLLYLKLMNHDFHLSSELDGLS